MWKLSALSKNRSLRKQSIWEKFKHNLILKHEQVFSNKPGETDLLKNKINLKADSKPVYFSPYRLSPEKTKFVNDEIKQLLEDGIIEPSDSPWGAPVVVVPKADGSLRLCTDLRKRNDQTIPDPFPMPRIEQVIDKVGKSKFLTKVDMTCGYCQIKIEDNSIPLTGFVTQNGHFQWKFMLFGCRNAPVTNIFKDCKECLIWFRKFRRCIFGWHYKF